MLLFVVLASTGRAMAQEDARKLFEAGKYQAVVEQNASDGSPAAQYLKGLAHLKLTQPDAAKEASDASTPTEPGNPSGSPRSHWPMAIRTARLRPLKRP